jgi:hypothetical protein
MRRPQRGRQVQAQRRLRALPPVALQARVPLPVEASLAQKLPA